jgi:peptide/nickel transport system substrate-binding protein
MFKSEKDVRVVSRRSRRLRAAFGLAAMVVVAAAPQASSQGRPKDELVIAINTTINTLNPPQTLGVQTDLSVISHLYSAIVTRTPDLQIKPDAAKSWELVDPTTWRFHFVEGVKFANGEALDANVAKWNIEQILDEKNKARLRGLFAPVIDKLTVVDLYTLEIRTKEPYLPLLSLLCNVFMLPPKWAATHDPAREAMGTGPYDLKENVSGDRVVMEAKPDYFGPKPPFKRVVFRNIPETASRTAALLAGEVDFVSLVPPEDIERINKSGVGKADAIPAARTMFVHLNTLIPPFKDNVPLRQAVNYAVDKQGIIDAVFGGYVKPANCQIVSDHVFGFQSDIPPYEYSTEKAKKLLSDAGLSNVSLELEVSTGRYLQSSQIVQIIAAQLEAVGIKVKISEVDYGTYLRRYANQQMPTMAYLGLSSQTLDADLPLTSVTTGAFSYWRNPTFEALIAKARYAAKPEERMAEYKEALDLMCKEAPFIFLFNQPFIYATSDRVVWTPRADDWTRSVDFRPR